MEITNSINSVPIRLTSERWTHIIENHDDLAGRMEDVLLAIEEPDWISQGYGNSLIAWRGFGSRNYLAVIYEKVNPNDGFVVTAYFTSKGGRRDKIWP